MKPTYTARQNQLKIARLKVERNIEGVTLREFRKGWREFYPLIRQLQKNDDPMAHRERQFWEKWGREFESALRMAWVNGVATIGDVEAAWFAARAGADLNFDPDSIVAEMEAQIGAKISRPDIVGVTREQVSDIISNWYTTDAGMADLVDKLQVWFGPDRARLIGITETTVLGSAVAREAMKQADVHGWHWANRNDDHVCPECLELGDPDIVYGDDDDEPPAHPGCRCGVSPIVGEGEDDGE